MTTETEIKLARYSERVKEVDSFGRIISVGRLKPSEQIKLVGMTPDLNGYQEMTNEKGELVRIPQRLPLIIVAAVRMIDDNHIPFPKNIGELYAMHDRLDTEGLQAAGIAFAKLVPKEELSEMPDGMHDPLAETKNL